MRVQEFIDQARGKLGEAHNDYGVYVYHGEYLTLLELFERVILDIAEENRIPCLPSPEPEEDE